MHHRKLILVIAIISIIQTSAIRVDTNNEPTKRPSESVDPKAEALTLVIHNFPMPKLRPVKLVDRNDDVLVIHSHRPKRKPTTRSRRPSSQFRSKIKPPTSSSSFGGFKDSSEFRFPPFPTKNFGEPQRASNKYKSGPKPYDGYSYSPPSKKKPKKKPSPVYGPPPSFSQHESSYDAPASPLNGQKLQTLQSIQQQQTHFPTFSIDAADQSAISDFYSASNDKFPQPINNFPLEQAPTYNSHKTSYGSPVRGSANPNNFNFSPNFLTTTLNSNLNANLGSQSNSYSNFNQNIPSQSQKTNSNQNSNFPKLPSRYEPKDFSTPTRPNPISAAGNQFLSNDFSGYNDGSESQNVPSTVNHNGNHNQHVNGNNRNRFNKFNNFDYDFGKGKNSAPEEDEDDGSYDYVYTTRRPTTTTTTEEPEPQPTKRPKKNVFGKRKRPAKIPANHNLDTDDLRDAFTEESGDFHEVSLNSDDFINFDSQRHNKRSQQQHLQEIHSTLKTAKKQSNALRTALGDNYEIVSVQKSLEKDPNEHDPFDFDQSRFERKHDQGFVVDSDIRFAPLAAKPVMWNGDVKNFPRNHRFS